MFLMCQISEEVQWCIRLVCRSSDSFTDIACGDVIMNVLIHTVPEVLLLQGSMSSGYS